MEVAGLGTQLTSDGRCEACRAGNMDCWIYSETGQNKSGRLDMHARGVEQILVQVGVSLPPLQLQGQLRIQRQHVSRDGGRKRAG